MQEVELNLQSLTLELEGGERSASHFGCFNPFNTISLNFYNEGKYVPFFRNFEPRIFQP